MRDYGKVYATFWTSETTRNLSDQGRLLALYLLSGPHTNMIGCFRLPDGYLMEDLGWEKETVSKGFSELFQKGFATRNDPSKWVFLHNFLRWNPIENPNQGKAAAKLFCQVPDSFDAKPELARSLLTQTGKVPDEELKRFLNRFETVSKPGTGTGTGTGAGKGHASPAIFFPPDLDCPEFRGAWQELEEYRKKRRLSKYQPETVQRRFKEFCKWGLAKAIEAIHNTIANGWDGIFEPKSSNVRETREETMIRQISEATSNDAPECPI